MQPYQVPPNPPYQPPQHQPPSYQPPPYQPPGPPMGPPPMGHSPLPVPPPSTPSRRGPAWWIPLVVAGVVAVVAVGAVAWLLSSTVPQSTYDGAEAEIAELRDRNDQLREELNAVTAANDDLERQLTDARPVAEVLAYMALDWPIESVDDFEDAGVGSTQDDLLATLGQDMSWRDWVVSDDVWRNRDRVISGLDDDATVDAWDDYWTAEIGSDEELAAYVEFQARLASMLFEAVND